MVQVTFAPPPQEEPDEPAPAFVEAAAQQMTPHMRDSLLRYENLLAAVPHLQRMGLLEQQAPTLPEITPAGQAVRGQLRGMAMSHRQGLRSWRARRLEACRAMDTLRSIVDLLQTPLEEDPSADCVPEPLGPHARAELHNLLTVALRTILLHNDGRVSPAKLQRF